MQRRCGSIRVIGIGAALFALAILAPGTALAGTAPADTVHIRGTAYAFFGIDDHMPGAVVRIDEFPNLSAPVAADGSYDIEVPDDANVTPYIDPPPGYNRTYLQTFHTSGQDLENVHFQVTPDLYYGAFAGLLSVPLDEFGKIKECVIVSTFSIHEARDATTFDPGFKSVYPHGLPDSTATIDPVQGNTRGPVYFNSSVIPDTTATASSVDGGVLWVEVPPGYYWLEPSNPTADVAPFLAHCEDGRLINASPPWGFYELKAGEQPDPAVMASPPDEQVDGKLVGEPSALRKGDRRVVRVEFKTQEPVEARLRLFRGEERLGKSEDQNFDAGKHAIEVQVRRETAAGPARVKLRLRDDAGNRVVVEKGVRVPK